MIKVGGIESTGHEVDEKTALSKDLWRKIACKGFQF